MDGDSAVNGPESGVRSRYTNAVVRQDGPAHIQACSVSTHEAWSDTQDLNSHAYKQLTNGLVP